VRTFDAMGKGTWFVSDKLDRLVRTTHMATDVWGWPTLDAAALIGVAQTSETSRWDQAGRKATTT
jgi:hypothetical protein